MFYHVSWGTQSEYLDQDLPPSVDDWLTLVYLCCNQIVHYLYFFLRKLPCNRKGFRSQNISYSQEDENRPVNWPQKQQWTAFATLYLSPIDNVLYCYNFNSIISGEKVNLECNQIRMLLTVQLRQRSSDGMTVYPKDLLKVLFDLIFWRFFCNMTDQYGKMWDRITVRLKSLRELPHHDH